MTSVDFLRDSSQNLVGFNVSGHSGYAEQGSDIVCAAVSSCTELVLNQLCDIFEFSVDCTIDPENAVIKCKILDCEKNNESKNIITGILEGFRKTVFEMSKEYPRFVKCTITEV